MDEWTSDRFAIAGNLETGEEYLVSVLDDAAHGHFPVPCPIVRVLRVAKYPHQRAIADPEIPIELPPIPSGTVCRLSVIRAANEKEMSLIDLSAQDAESAALDRAFAEAKSREERDILHRHKAGHKGGKRIMITFLKGDLEFLQRCEKEFSKRMKKHAQPDH